MHHWHTMGFLQGQVHQPLVCRVESACQVMMCPLAAAERSRSYASHSNAQYYYDFRPLPCWQSQPGCTPCVQADKAAEHHLAQANAALVGCNAIVNKGRLTVTALAWEHERPKPCKSGAAANLFTPAGVQAG